eukprot:jgi/Ulvmu1/12359/UM009_0005.1
MHAKCCGGVYVPSAREVVAVQPGCAIECGGHVRPVLSGVINRVPQRLQPSPAGGRYYHARAWPCAAQPCQGAISISRRRCLTCEAQHASPVAWPDGKKKRRLDDVCCEMAPEYSKNVVQGFILAGKVFVDDTKITKAGHQVTPSATVDIRAEVPKFVSRAGLKLEKALDHFDIDVTGLTCLDSGLSTGGFSDCLLQRGAEKVFGVDVGYGHVADRVRNDPRMCTLERTNLRHLTPYMLGGSTVQLFTLDLSFISVLKVLPAVCGVAAVGEFVQAVVLVKPQFEVGTEAVGKGGVVRDAAARTAAVQKVVEGFAAQGWVSRGVVESPVRGAKAGNIEYLAHFVKEAQQ